MSIFISVGHGGTDYAAVANGRRESDITGILGWIIKQANLRK